MNTRYDALLSDWMIKLNLLKEKSYYNKKIFSGIDCDCKNIILNNYLISIKNLVIPIISLVQLAKYQKDKKTLKCYFKTIEEYHIDECFKFLYYKENISHKTLFIFEYLHNKIFKTLVDEIENTIMDFVGYNYQEEYVIVNWLCQILYDLMEVGILILSGLRINSFNISTDIFHHKNFKYNIKDMALFNTKLIKNCPYSCRDFCDIKNGNMICEDDRYINEELHLFIVPEYYIDKNFIDTYFEIIFKYHCMPENIDIILDYQLIPDLNWSDVDFNLIVFLKDKIKSLKIINYKGINFNKYYKEVKPFLTYEE